MHFYHHNAIKSACDWVQCDRLEHLVNITELPVLQAFTPYTIIRSITGTQWPKGHTIKLYTQIIMK